jgi:hypothetical protein
MVGLRGATSADIVAGWFWRRRRRSIGVERWIHLE